MVVIRLARGGAKKHPFYNIVVTDSRRPRDSGYLEKLGYFNPSAVKEEKPIFLDQDRFDHWISKGAQLSQRVSHLASKWRKEKLAVDSEAASTGADDVAEQRDPPTADALLSDAEAAAVAVATAAAVAAAAESSYAEAPLPRDDNAAVVESSAEFSADDKKRDGE